MPANPQRSPEQFRVAGSGLTVFAWQNQPIAFAQSIGEVSPQPVAAPEAIQPMDAPTPMEILVPHAVGPGTLQVQLFERYTTKVWDDMMRVLDESNIAGDNRVDQKARYSSLLEIFNRMANLGNGITAQKRVFAPDRVGQKQWFADMYFNCKITDVRDDEDINIGTMSVVKSMSIMYTHKESNRYAG